MLRSFKIIQGNRNWYQSKAHMRLPISHPLYLSAYLLPFPRYNGFYWSKICVFSPFLSTPVSFKAFVMGGFPGTYGTKFGRKKARILGLPEGGKPHDPMIVSFESIPASETDGHAAKPRSSTAERDKNYWPLTFLISVNNNNNNNNVTPPTAKSWLSVVRCVCENRVYLCKMFYYK